MQYLKRHRWIDHSDYLIDTTKWIIQQILIWGRLLHTDTIHMVILGISNRYYSMDHSTNTDLDCYIPTPLPYINLQRQTSMCHDYVTSEYLKDPAECTTHWDPPVLTTAHPRANDGPPLSPAPPTRVWGAWRPPPGRARSRGTHRSGAVSAASPWNWRNPGNTSHLAKKEGNVLFNDALNTFYLRIYGIRHMVKDHSDSEKGNLLPPHRLLFPISSKGSFICTIPQTG